MDYIAYLYYKIKNYFFNDEIKYIMPFDANRIENSQEFAIFKSKSSEINKVVYVLNNLPDNAHDLIFKDNESVCSHYYYITLKIIDNTIEITHNLENINCCNMDKKINYIYIRINIITVSKLSMHHVNCIICDKINNTILIFDPQVDFIYDTDVLINILNKHTDISDYRIIFPIDLGYGSYNHLQKYDAFCQTYTLFTLMMVINNPTVKYNQYSLMFNTSITHKNIGYLLYRIYELLKENNYDINIDDEFWSYPTNKFTNMWNLTTYFFKSKNNQSIESNIEIHEDDDLLIIDTVR